MSAHSITSRGLAGRKIPQGTLTPIGTLLFSASEPGAFYDPSDLSTLFQDAAGTTPVTAVEQPMGRMLDKSGRGNHATQSTTTKRPVLSRRVNFCLASNDVRAAAWSKSAVVTHTPTSFTFSAGGFLASGNAGTNVVPGMQMRWSALVDSSTRVVFFGGATPAGSDVYTLTDMGGGLYRQSVVRTFSVTATATVQAVFGSAVGTFVVGEPSLVFMPDAHLPYQRCTTATDYDADPAKFPAYRRLDGVDDSHVSATGGGGTAGFFFSASVTPQGGAGTARTLFSDAGTNTGYIVRINTSNQLELAAGNGTAYTTVATAGTLAVGSTDIVQAWDDGTNLNVKIGNGAAASIARPAVSAGTAGYTMGQDNGASTGYFNGRVYSTIYRKDSGLTQVQREAVALYQRQKARMP